VHDADCRITVLNVTVSPSGDDDFWSLTNELKWTLGYTNPSRKYLVFLDRNHPDICGQGDVIPWRIDPSADDPNPAYNPNNNTYGFAVIYNGCWSSNVTISHELAHNFGAVQGTSPNHSQWDHCTDEWDVMCYADGGPNNLLSFPCNSLNSQSDEAWDCGEDDYFSPSPAPGSYLASHWNVQSAPYMCPLDLCQTRVDLPTLSFQEPASIHGGQSFTARAVTTGGRPIVRYEWWIPSPSSIDFGPPTVAGTDPSVTIPAGVVSFTGAAIADDGAVVMQSALRPRIAPIIVQLLSTFVQPPSTFAVRFDGSSSRDDDGDPLTYSWDFTSDGSQDATGAVVTHVYPGPGRYTATLTVSDPGGSSAQMQQTFTIDPVLRPAVSTARRCVVPPLLGKTLAVARARLRAAHCALGPVAHRHARRGRHKPRIVAQKPRAGRVRHAGAPVKITLSA